MVESHCVLVLFLVLISSVVSVERDRFVTPLYSSQLPVCPKFGRQEFGFLRETRGEDGQKLPFDLEFDDNKERISCRKANGDAGPRKTIRSIAPWVCRRMAMDPAYAAFEHTEFRNCTSEPCEFSTRCDLYEHMPNHRSVAKLEEDLGEKGYWVDSECWTKSLERFTPLTLADAPTVSGYCRTTHGAKPNGVFTVISTSSFVECAGASLRAGSKVKAFEFDENLDRCELHTTIPTHVQPSKNEAGVWCFSKKESLITIPHSNIPLQAVTSKQKMFCRKKFRTRYLRSPILANTGDTESHVTDVEELVDYFTFEPDESGFGGFEGSEGTDIRSIPYETCYYSGEDSECFQTDAAVFRQECLCSDILPDQQKLSASPLAQRIRAAFKPKALKRCYVRFLRTANRLLRISKKKHWKKTRKALKQFRPHLEVACDRLEKERFPGETNVFDKKKCVRSATFKIMTREVEAALSCYATTAICPGELRDDSNTCHAWTGGRNPWFW